MPYLSRLFFKYIDNYKGFNAFIWVVVNCLLINNLSAMVMTFFAIYLSAKLSYSSLWVAFVLFSYGLGRTSGTYSGGILSDKFDLCKLSILSFILASINTFILQFLSQIYLLCIFIFCLGFLNGALRPPIILLLFKNCKKEEKYQVSGLMRVFGNLGIALASLLGGFLAFYNYHLVFTIGAIVQLIASLVLIKYRKLNLNHDIISEKNEKKTKKAPLIFRILFVTSVFFASLIFFQTQHTYPLYLHDFLSVGTEKIGLVYFLSGFIIVFFEVPILNHLKKIRPSTLSSIGSLMMGFGMIVLLISNAIGIIILSIVLWTFGEILFFSSMVILSLSNSKTHGKSMGTFQSMISFSAMIAPIIGFYIYNKNPAYLWLTCMILGSLAAIMIVFASEFRKNKKCKM